MTAESKTKNQNAKSRNQLRSRGLPDFWFLVFGFGFLASHVHHFLKSRAISDRPIGTGFFVLTRSVYRVGYTATELNHRRSRLDSPDDGSFCRMRDHRW